MIEDGYQGWPSPETRSGCTAGILVSTPFLLWGLLGASAFGGDLGWRNWLELAFMMAAIALPTYFVGRWCAKDWKMRWVHMAGFVMVGPVIIFLAMLLVAQVTMFLNL